MSFSYAGYPGVTLDTYERERDPEQGWQSVITYKGTPAAINGLVPLLIQDKLAFRIRPEGKFSTLEIRSDEAMDGESEESKEEQLSITWDMPANDLEKDLFTLPGIEPAPHTSANRALVISTIKLYLEKVAKGEITAEDAPDFGTTVANEIFQLKAAGVESYTVGQFVVRRTIILEKSSTRLWSVLNNGKQFTTDQLVTDYKAQENLKVELPDGAWLMRTTTSTQQPNGKVQIVEEWWHADTWNQFIWPARIVEEVVT